MAVAANPEISKILLDLGIEPVDVYAVDNAEKTYTAALVEGINTLEVANKGESTRSKILRDELKTIREKKRKVRVSKLFTKTSIVPVNKIKPQSLLPPSEEPSPSGSKQEGFRGVLKDILGILKLGFKSSVRNVVPGSNLAPLIVVLFSVTNCSLVLFPLILSLSADNI